MIDYRYNGVVLKWVDGDTVDIMVDLGFTVSVRQRFRLLGVNTPEKGEAGYVEATGLSNAYVPVGSKVTLQSKKTDKYGRYLAEVFPSTSTVSVNAFLASKSFGF